MAIIHIEVGRYIQKVYYSKRYIQKCARLLPLFKSHWTLKWEGIFKSLCSFNAIIHIELKWEGIFKSLCSFNAIIHIEVRRYIQKSVLV